MSYRSQGSLDTFRDKPVVAWKPEIDGDTLSGVMEDEPSQDEVVFKLATTYDAAYSWPELFEAFLKRDEANEVTELVVGAWWNEDDIYGEEAPAEMVDALAKGSAELPSLRHLYIGDISQEECEISWLTLCDFGPLLKAYPHLETLHIQGSNHLRLSGLSSATLRELMIMSGGLPALVIGDIAAADLPNLSHLELYIGTPDYGGIHSIDPLKPLLNRSFPSLRYLGLKNAAIASEVAVALRSSSLLPQLTVLDLSLGALDDSGAEAILSFPALPQLRTIDLEHHYCSDEMIAKLQSFADERGILIYLNEQLSEEFEEYRYVSISE